MFWFLYPVSARRGGSSGASLWTARRVVAPHGQPPRLPRYFRGMAPTEARRARPVQRSGHQGLRGNPDACRPRRGSACNETNNGAPAEAQRSGFGGERRHSGGNELCRLRRSERSVTCADEAGGNACPVFTLSVQPTAAMGSGSRVEGAGGAFDENPREATSKNAGPGGFPTAFDSKSGAPAGQARAPGVPRPTGAHTGAPLRQTRRPEEGVGRRVKDAAPYDSGRTKWARGSGRSHGTTCPAARERGTSMSRWLVLPRNRAA